MKFYEQIVISLRFLTRVPPSLYLAGSEAFIKYSVVINTELLMESLSAHVAAPMTTINMSMGFVYAMILTFLLDINWAAVLLVIMTLFVGLLTEWNKEEIPTAGRLTAAFALSWILTAVQPVRMAFMAEQIPKTVKDTYSRRYFSFIVACSLISDSSYWIYVFMRDSETTTYIAFVSIIFFCFTLLYSGLIIYIEISTKYKRQYFKAPIHIDRVCHEKGQKHWDLYHIAMTLTAQTFAVLITTEARAEQYRAVMAEYNLFVGEIPDITLYGAFPGIVGILVLLLALLVVEPVLRRLGIGMTDLKYIGAGMIFGCISMAITSIMQRSLDTALRPPNRNEGLLFIFNTLPTITSFRSMLFDRDQHKWLQVQARSKTTFYATDIIGKREFQVSISNPNQDYWDEDFMRLEDGKLSSYVIANGKLTEMKGLQLTQDAFINKGKIYIGCTLKICVGNIYFHKGNTIEVVSLPENDKFTAHHLKEGTYNVTTFIMTEREYTISDNFTIQNTDILAGLVVDDEGDANLLSYNVRHPETVPLYLLILQDIFVAARDSLFGIGVLRFLWGATNPSCPSRQFTYAAFFLLYKGLPWMIFGGVRIGLATFNSFFLNFFLLYYGCCTALFMHTAYIYERKWPENQRE